MLKRVRHQQKPDVCRVKKDCWYWMMGVVSSLKYQMFTFDLPASSSSQSQRAHVGINRSERCMWYISQLSGSEMWFQGRSGGSTGRLGGVFAHFRQGCPSNAFDLTGWLQYLLCGWFINISLWSCQGQDVLPKGKLPLKWGHESQVCEYAAHTHTRTHTHTHTWTRTHTHKCTHTGIQISSHPPRQISELWTCKYPHWRQFEDNTHTVFKPSNYAKQGKDGSKYIRLLLSRRSSWWGWNYKAWISTG